jgi:hypothetical protein
MVMMMRKVKFRIGMWVLQNGDMVYSAIFLPAKFCAGHIIISPDLN